MSEEKANSDSGSRHSGVSILADPLKLFDPVKYRIQPVTLETSLSRIPIYTHLKVYDLKPTEIPQIPPLLAELRSTRLPEIGTSSCDSLSDVNEK